MNKFGLVQLSNSAQNSPLHTELPTKRHVVEPLKLSTLKKYQPIVPSPLTTTSPFNVVSKENKENAETQTFEFFSVSTQTTISVPHVPPRITEQELMAERPSVNYLRVLADRLQTDLDSELERNLRLVEELCTLDEQLSKTDRDMTILEEVFAEIEEEQEAKEVGTADL
ncbi:unnamed protein product [Caenorhabditis sp. 36 PRJEB53466]|nr:unnamed protein product [Caenorhabditis sp. 36 PRJEB53466]